MNPGEVWKHRSGLTVRVIARHAPGDRDDEPRVYCEVVAPYENRHPESPDYPVGYKDGWYLDEALGWARIVGDTDAITS